MTATEKAAELRRLERRARELRREIKKARPKTPRPKTPGKTRDARRLERSIRLKVAREVVMKRANGKCELCGREGFVLEAHHLLSGPLRRLGESAETMLGICADDHRALHRNDRDTLRRASEVAQALGMFEARRAIERRLDKLERSGT